MRWRHINEINNINNIIIIIIIIIDNDFYYWLSALGIYNTEGIQVKMLMKIIMIIIIDFMPVPIETSGVWSR